jgi:hypothetical protein
VDNLVRTARLDKDLAALAAATTTTAAAGDTPARLRGWAWDAATGGWLEPFRAVSVLRGSPAHAALLRLAAAAGQAAVYEYATDDSGSLVRTVVPCGDWAGSGAQTLAAARVVAVQRPGPGVRHPLFAQPDWFHLYPRADAVLALFARVRARSLALQGCLCVLACVCMGWLADPPSPPMSLLVRGSLG